MKVIKANIVKSAMMDVEHWEELSNHYHMVPDQMLYHVIDGASLVEIWAKLEANFLDKTLANKIYLETIICAEDAGGANLTEHVNAFN